MAQTRLSTEDLVASGPVDNPDAADETRTDETRTETRNATSTELADTDAPLLEQEQSADLLARWGDVQARFVDDPQGAVRDADSLVAELMQSLAQRFSQYKSDLEGQWQRGDQPETEDLRLALQQYRSFFQRLLAT